MNLFIMAMVVILGMKVLTSSFKLSGRTEWDDSSDAIDSLVETIIALGLMSWGLYVLYSL